MVKLPDIMSNMWTHKDGAKKTSTKYHRKFTIMMMIISSQNQ